MSYLNFHCHSVYSVKDALSEPIDIAKINKSFGNTAFCITDHGTLGSWIQAYKAAKKTEMQFIPGCEFYVAPEDPTLDLNNKSNKDIELSPLAKKYFHFIAIAKNQTGVENLIKIFNNSSERYRKNITTTEDIFNNSEGLIVTNACIGGELAFYINNNMEDKARDFIKRYKQHFGDDFYIELQHHNITDLDEARIYSTMVSLAKEYHVKMIVTTDSHFNYKEDSKWHDMYVQMYYDNFKFDFKTPEFPPAYGSDGYWIMNEEEIRSYIKNITALTEQDIDEAIANTIEIRNKCEETHFPEAKALVDKSAALKIRVREGFMKKRAGTEYEEESRERIKFELDTINKMGFSEYFINVRNIINRAKDLHILTGPARGCFLPGTQVNLEEGCKNIEDVVKDDRVLTQAGICQVAGTHEYDVDEECIELQLSNGKSIRCTLDHKIYSDGKWVPAKDLVIGSRLFTPDTRTNNNKAISS